MTLHFIGKFTMGKLISSLLSNSLLLEKPSLPVSRCNRSSIRICGTFYFKFNGIDTIKKISQHFELFRVKIAYIAEREIELWCYFIFVFIAYQYLNINNHLLPPLYINALFYARHHDLANRLDICVTIYHWYVPLVVIISRSFPFISYHLVFN